MALKKRGLATVIEQEEDRVRVQQGDEELTVRMAGFPAGFQLRRGDRVSLTEQASGPVAMPLVRTVRTRMDREEFREARAVEAEGRALARQDASVIDEPEAEDEAEAGEVTYWVVEREDDEGPGQVIAARRPHR